MNWNNIVLNNTPILQRIARGFYEAICIEIGNTCRHVPGSSNERGVLELVVPIRHRTLKIISRSTVNKFLNYLHIIPIFRNLVAI